MKSLCKNEITINEAQSFSQELLALLHLKDEEDISYDAESLFTNILVKETIHNIIDQIYVQRKVPPICTKLMFKRFLLKLPTEWKFTFLNSFYQQTVGCTISSPLSVAFRDNCIVKLENHIVTPPKPKFYRRYVDDIFIRKKVNLNDILFE